MNKVWKKSAIGIVCAGGLYAGVLYNVQDQVNAADIQKNAYLQKVQEQNNLIKKLNADNQKLYQLQLSYNQTVNDTNQKSQQINALTSQITQIKKQIAAMAVRSSSHKSANTGTATTEAQAVVKPLSPAPVVTSRRAPAPRASC